jgi:hypothetical protein
VLIGGQEIRPANIDYLQITNDWQEGGRLSIEVAQRKLDFQLYDAVTVSFLKPLPRWRLFIYRLIRRRRPEVVLGSYVIIGVTHDWAGYTIDGVDQLTYFLRSRVPST